MNEPMPIENPMDKVELNIKLKFSSEHIEDDCDDHGNCGFAWGVKLKEACSKLNEEFGGAEDAISFIDFDSMPEQMREFVYYLVRDAFVNDTEGITVNFQDYREPIAHLDIDSEGL